jgi:Flp pilus assembly pilin Flp
MQPHRLRQSARACWHEDDGQDLAEYALLLFFIALAAVLAMTGLGLSIGGMWGGVTQQLAAAL